INSIGFSGARPAGKSQKPQFARWRTLLNAGPPDCNCSQTPGISGSPNCRRSVGRRRSPSIKRTFCTCRCANAIARFAEIRLLPSSAMLLVISTFLISRACRNCRRRTARKRNFSAPSPSFSVSPTNLLSSAGVTVTDLHWLRASSGSAITSVGCEVRCGQENGTPVRSDSDRCNASNNRLMPDAPVVRNRRTLFFQFFSQFQKQACNPIHIAPGPFLRMPGWEGDHVETKIGRCAFNGFGSDVPILIGIGGNESVL